MVSIPISTNIVKTIANLIYYLYSDNDNKQYRRMQTNKTSTRKRTTERESCQPHNRTIQAKKKRATERERRASLTTELKNMDRSSNSEQHRQMRERQTSEERDNIDRQTVKKEDNHDHNNFVSYQCIKYFTKLTKIFLHLITASANAYYIGKILRDRNYNTSGLTAGLASNYNYVIKTDMFIHIT